MMQPIKIMRYLHDFVVISA